MSVGIPAESFGFAEEFLQSNRRYQTACLITDLRVPGMSGLELQRTLATEGWKVPTIFMTAHRDTEMRVRALRGDAIAFLCKPFDDGVLLQLLCAALGGHACLMARRGWTGVYVLPADLGSTGG